MLYSQKMIILKNVRVHNLKGVDLILRPGELIAFTGVSGSGKSSLAIDTLYREGQRRTLEALPYSLQRLIQIPEAPEADKIEGLSPCIAIDQRRAGHNPRSTVATVTGIYDFLRVLFARAAPSQSLEQILATLHALPEELVYILAPLHNANSDQLRSEGFLRLRINGAWIDLEETSIDLPSSVELVVDRVSLNQRGRLAEAVIHALELGQGTVHIHFPKSNQERTFSRHTNALEPIHFSFNHPAGMCDACKGLGCTECGGSRLKPHASKSRLNGKTIAEVTAMTIEEAAHFFQKTDAKELLERLHFLIEIGISYLTLDRAASTLSGGELQRARLAEQLSAGLVGATYLLDEPSLGLHASDHDRLIRILYKLRDRGNTVIVVEHDADLIRAADTIVEIGPGAGEEGGQIVAQGTLAEISDSLTGAYLSGRKQIAPPRKRRKPTGETIDIINANTHNLKNLSVSIPKGLLTCITGVSGSGKSSLVTELFRQPLRIVSVDQSPIGRSPRSICATYLQLFDEIRDLFAALPETKLRGWTSAHFSFNSPEGACPHCKGLGCPLCQGRRFRPEILSIQYKGHSIADLLDLTIRRARELLGWKKLDLLCDIGLGYLPLGQTAPTFSGGEAQRLKLAVDLLRPSKEKVIYLFDEPTSGLHFHDISRLLKILQERVDAGHTVIVIEHNLDLIRAADWVIDLGPGAGAAGGQIVGEGTPDQIAKLNTLTGRALRSDFSKQRATKPILHTKPTAIQVDDLTLPYHKWIALCGPDKRALAFDTIYAESQLRYFETLPTYFRQSLPTPKQPTAQISGLPLTIALRHSSTRATIGALTGLADLLRRAHDQEIMRQKLTPASLAEQLESRYPNQLISVLAPLTSHPELSELLRTLGFLRVRLDGTFHELDDEPPFATATSVELLIDRVDSRQSQRLREALELGARHSFGPMKILVANQELAFNFSSPATPFQLPEGPLANIPHERAQLLTSLGLGHLSLTRAADTLSSGEFHLLQIARLLHSGLSSCLYIFEEPVPTEAHPLLRILRDRGNTLLTFDPTSADLLIGDPPAQVRFPAHKKRTPPAITCITGPIGSGKSTLLRKMQTESTFEHTLFLDAAPLHHNLRSEVGTYSNLMPLLRTLFASLPSAKAKGWTASHFSFNHPRGMCTQCRGLGVQQINLHFLPPTEVPCEGCRGTRLNPVALSIHYKGKHLGQISRLTVAEAFQLFEPITRLRRRLQLLLDLGLSHLTLDQETSTLSISEGQRLRLFTQLAKWMPDPTLYLFDTPSSGLSDAELLHLIPLFQRLADAGHTLVFADNNPHLVAQADMTYQSPLVSQ